jgi:hypothetical protein
MGTLTSLHPRDCLRRERSTVPSRNLGGEVVGFCKDMP